MGTEIERKFLLADASWRAQIERSTPMTQGYLVDAMALANGLARCSVRVRIEGDQARLNVKSARLGIERSEFEYPLPVTDARQMLDELCNGQVEKVRHEVIVHGHTFEIDEFLGDNAGLVVAELELSATDIAYPHPPWLGREVSAMPRYYNVNLIEHPYAHWSAAERAGGEVN